MEDDKLGTDMEDNQRHTRGSTIWRHRRRGGNKVGTCKGVRGKVGTDQEHARAHKCFSASRGYGPRYGIQYVSMPYIYIAVFKQILMSQELLVIQATWMLHMPWPYAVSAHPRCICVQNATVAILSLYIYVHIYICTYMYIYIYSHMLYQYTQGAYVFRISLQPY